MCRCTLPEHSAAVRRFTVPAKSMLKNLIIVAIAFLAGSLTACSTIPTPSGPVAAEPFPFQWKFVSDRKEPELQLCWIEEKQTVGCLDWPSSIKTKEDRNNFQHALFGVATSLCADFRATLANQPTKALWVGIVSELLSAASPVISDETRSRVVGSRRFVHEHNRQRNRQLLGRREDRDCTSRNRVGQDGHIQVRHEER